MSGTHADRIPSRPRCAVVVICVVAVVAAGVEVPTWCQPPDVHGKPDLDVRLPVEPIDRGGFVLRTPTLAQRAAADLLAATVPGGIRLRWDGMSASPKWISAAGDGMLSGAEAGAPADVARRFIARHAALFGVDARAVEGLRSSAIVSDPSGGHHVYFTQTVRGIEVLHGGAQVNLEPDGSVRSVSSRLYAGLNVSVRAAIDPELAVRLAAQDVYPGIVFEGTLIESEQGRDRRTAFDGAGFGMDPVVRLKVFPEASGARLAWEARVAEPTLITSYVILIDATTGEILYRVQTTKTAEARYLDASYPDPATEEFDQAAHVLATIPDVTPESDNGWIDGGGTELTGNNASSRMDHTSLAGLVDPAGVFDYPFNTPESALVNAWWWANEAHDIFYRLGFDEQAGNFQNDNFGRGGVGGDALSVVKSNQAWRNNAYFASYSDDGEPSSITFMWSDCRFCGDHDGLPEAGPSVTVGERSTAFVRDLIVHEYTHGVSSRRVGGPSVGPCLQGVQSGALAEAWSYAMPASLWGHSTPFDYFLEGIGVGIDARNDLDYADLCEVDNFGCETHADGMIFFGALWDLRSSMLALDPVSGLDDFHRLVVEGFASTDCLPTFLDARDGMLDADSALFAQSHHDVIWNAFASRGMGYLAISTSQNDTAPVVDSTVPAEYGCTPPDPPTDVSAAADGDNAILVQYTAAGASGVEIWREDLDHPFDRAERIALTDDPASYRDESVQGGKSYRYHVVPYGTGGLPCAGGASPTADVTATGSCSTPPVFDPQLAVADGDPSCAVTLTWNAAQPGCPGSAEPIVYNVYRGPTPGFEPSGRLLLGRTTSTTFTDVPPDTTEFPSHIEMGHTSFYLVTAQHGTPGDPPDHRLPGSAQILDWEPAIPTLGRTVVEAWDFDSGPQGWTADNSGDPVGGWVVADPSPTVYGGALAAPDGAAGGIGQAWVTGDAGGPSGVFDFDCDGRVYLESPTWDGTGGATIVSFDHWSVLNGNFWNGLDIEIRNGAESARVGVAGLRTVPRFETDGHRGWQRYEIDVADWVDPTTTMSLLFRTTCAGPVAEFGVDNVRVESANVCARSGLQIVSVAVDDSPPGWGNANGVLEPGETARLVVTVGNNGKATASSPTSRLTSGSHGVLIHEPVATFDDIPPAGSVVSAPGTFTVTAPTAANCEDTLVFDFELVDAAGAVTHDYWNPEFGTAVTETVFADTFETDKGWIRGGVPGSGIMERGDPVGTTNGSEMANPEDDSPNDEGAQCYVTENGVPGGEADVNDVDQNAGWPRLVSPQFDLTGFKRARASFDLWYYDDSGADPGQDYGLNLIRVHPSLPAYDHVNRFPVNDTTGGWTTVNRDLTRLVPMVSAVSVQFWAYDRETDDIVEFGIDNFLLEADRVECAALGVTLPPNGIGDTLRVSKSMVSAELSWQASAGDAGHDGAAYYRVLVSAAPDAGFGVQDTATETRSERPLDGATEHYLISAVNAAGTSGDEPAP